MNKLIKTILLIILGVAGAAGVMYMMLNHLPTTNFHVMAVNNITVVFSTIIIITFLMIKAYMVIVNNENGFLGVLRLSVLIGLALILAVNVIFDMNPEIMLHAKLSAAFRTLALIGMVLVIEHYITYSLELRKYVVLILYAIIIQGFIFIGNLSLDILMGIYYYSLLLLLIYENFKWEGKPDRIRALGYYLILVGLLNDLLVLTTGIVKYELSFLSVAITLTLIYAGKFIHRYRSLESVEQENLDLKKAYERISLEKERTLKSVELLKSDLSYKFMKKQNYFENLELAVEVLEGSIIVINDEFKVDLAYGGILEVSGIEDMTGVDVSRALFDISSDEGQYFKSVVTKIFNAEDEVRENLFLSLLDKTLRIGSVVYEMKYYVMRKKNGHKVMVIHADILNEHTKQGAQLIREKAVSDMLITITKNSEIFFSDYASYVLFCRGVDQQIDESKGVDENIFKILRRVHTYKGIFDQYHMQSTVRGLHDVENELFNILHNQSNVTMDQFKRNVQDYELESLLNEDVHMIESRLGKQFMANKMRIQVDMTDFDRLLIQMGETFGKDHDLIREMETLKHIDVKEVIESYRPYVERIAEEQGKKVRFLVEGDRVKVSRSKHINFFESLIHILKNSVAHGVEYPDERGGKGKSPVAEIRCHVSSEENQMVLTISDDGRGVDVKEIKNRLFILGKYSIDELDELSDDVICNMIVEDGITSAAMPNSLSGRGVGMGSIKEVVELLEGSISVKSESGRGVTYRIVLPYSLDSDMYYHGDDLIQKNLSLQIERVLTKSERKDILSKAWSFEEKSIGNVDLHEVVCMVRIQGRKETTVCLSLDEKLIYHLVNAYGLQMKYKGANLKVMNEAVIMFLEDVSNRLSEDMKGPRQNLQISHGNIISAMAFKKEYGAKHAHCATIRLNEGYLTTMVMNNIG